jgi:hypothetical protein
MSLLSHLERRLRFLAVPHVLPIVLSIQVFLYLTGVLFGMVDLSRAIFSWELVAAGEWWRVFTFIVYPPGCHWALFAFGIYCTYFLGSSIEQEWGTLKFNLFLLTGWVLTIVAGFFAPYAALTNEFIAGSLLLAFAYYSPNYVFQIYFVFPVQVKYLALLALFLSTLAFFNGGPATQLAVGAALGNYLLFLGPAMLRDLRSGRRKARWHAKQKAAHRETAAAGPRHACVVCGKNSDTHPDEDFRYRADDRCYCSEHLRAPLSAGPAEAGR